MDKTKVSSGRIWDVMWGVRDVVCVLRCACTEGPRGQYSRLLIITQNPEPEMQKSLAADLYRARNTWRCSQCVTNAPLEHEKLCSYGQDSDNQSPHLGCAVLCCGMLLRAVLPKPAQQAAHLHTEHGLRGEHVAVQQVRLIVLVVAPAAAEAGDENRNRGE